jgi:hypothetical protein
MTTRRQQMMAPLQLSGKAECTPQDAVRAVRLLAQCSRTAPALISAQALQPYVLHRKHMDRRAPSSLRLCSSAIRCFSHHVPGRAWKTLALMRAESAPRLPALLRLGGVHRL